VCVRNSTPAARSSRIWRWYHDAGIWKCVKTRWRWSIAQTIGQWFRRVHRFSLLCHIIMILPALPIPVYAIYYIFCIKKCYLKIFLRHVYGRVGTTGVSPWFKIYFPYYSDYCDRSMRTLFLRRYYTVI